MVIIEWPLHGAFLKPSKPGFVVPARESAPDGRLRGKIGFF